MHIIMAKAVAFGEVLDHSFADYAKQVMKNSQKLAEELMNRDFDVISGGTDNHLMLLDLTNKGISGKKAEITLGSAGITVNKNMIPFDTKSPFVTSGIRVGTPAATTRGMKEPEMEKIAEFIDKAISNSENEEVLLQIKNDVKKLCSGFPLYSEIRN